MPKKIFELAKELDVKPLDLVDKLKSVGFNVRNHMSVLEDDQIEKAIEAMKPAESDTGATKKKKATVRKKAAKKVAKKVAKVAKKTTKKSVAAKSLDSEELDADGVAKKAVKRKTVVRRKSGKKESDVSGAEDTLAASSTEAVALEEEVTSLPIGEAVLNVTEPSVESSSEASSEKSDSGDQGGLRVVSRPELVAKKEVVTESTEDSEPQGATDKKVLYKEKVHKFTPVFIPEKKPETETKAKEPAAGAPGAAAADGKATDEDGKKRLGGLASMMSGKKQAVSKSQLLNQDRADSELKSYAALSLTGRPLYSQIKRKKMYAGPTRETEITEVKESKRIIKLHDGAYAEQLAKSLKVKLKELINKCLSMNLLVRNGDYIGMKLASEIATHYDYRVENVAFDEAALLNAESENKPKDSQPLRDPIITVMGHVDHGKTTLIDHIRNAKVAQAEAGGITQHIGAYSVEVNDRTITFLDTPGHAAFANMRQRGANVTDIVVLIVAADDGAMPQTKESIKFCQNAGVPIVVAVNKMDKEGVNPDRVKQELTELNLAPEEWGGDTQFVPISALKGDGIDELLEAILLQAEILELRADPKGRAEGIVIESKVEPGRGAVSTVLIQSGTLKKGDSIVVGETYGRARQLTNHLGEIQASVGPSKPVQILGLQDAPSPGDSLNVVKNEREAKKVAQNRIDERKQLEISSNTRAAANAVSLEDFFATAAGTETSGLKELNLIIRTDVQGSYEAIKQSLEALSNSEVGVKIIGGGVGAISDSDINLAISAGAVVIGFNMRPINTARRIAENNSIEVKTYSIIYELLNDVTLALEGMLEPDYVEEFIGRAQVKEAFSIPKIGVIAGSSVVDGKIAVGCNIRLLRDGKILFDGKLNSLKRFKDDVKEVKNGYECGIGLDEYEDVRADDVFEAYVLTPKKRSLEDVAKEEEIEARRLEKEKLAAEKEAVAEAEAEAEKEAQL